MAVDPAAWLAVSTPHGPFCSRPTDPIVRRPGDGVYYPVDEARLQKLRDITAEIRYAEEPSSSPLYETSTGLATSQESELSDDDDDDSRRKQD